MPHPDRFPTRPPQVPTRPPPMPPRLNTWGHTPRDVGKPACPNGLRRLCDPLVGKGVGSDSTTGGIVCPRNNKHQTVVLDHAGRDRDSLVKFCNALLHAAVRTGAGPTPRGLTRMLSPSAACKAIGQASRYVPKAVPPSSPRRWLSAPVSEDTRLIRTAVMLMFPHHTARNIMHWGSARGC